MIPIIMKEYEIIKDYIPQKSYCENDYIYVKNEDEILKLRLNFKRMDIVDLIEEYIKNEDVYSFKVLSEEEIKKKYNNVVKFFPFVGKYRIEGNLKKTNNYFVPKLNDLFLLLVNLYNNSDNIITSDNFQNLYSIYIKNNELSENNRQLIGKLISSIDIILEERLDFNILRKQIGFTTNFFRDIDLENYRRLKYWLESSLENENKFNKLGLDTRINFTKGKQKHI